MKIPYIKLYTADLLAISRHVTSEQLGDALLGVCELAFENKTLYEPQTACENTLFELLLTWKEESKIAWKQNKKIAKQAARVRWKKQQFLDGASSIPTTNAIQVCHTETETETDTETDTETENILLTAPGKPAQTEREISLPEKKLPLPAEFTDQVIARFESVVQNPVQKSIFLKRNARCLKDILDFCDHDIPLALQTISVCADRLAKQGLTGGYEAVCRNLPEYYEKAKAQLAQQRYD